MLATQHRRSATRSSRCATPTPAARSPRSASPGTAVGRPPPVTDQGQLRARRLPYRSPFRDYSDADYIAACVADLRDVIDTATSGDIACMIVEPVQGVGGFASPPDGLFHAFRRSCRSTESC